MPRAVVDVTPQHFDLKTCPPDGFVEIVRMPYAKWLHRTDISMAMQIEMEERKQRNKRTTEKSGRHMDMKFQNQAVTAFEFKNCIVAHNLEDEHGNPLDFNNPAALLKLDARIGTEIGELINELHEPLSEEEEGN
jgi:hypothetical protein